MAELFVVGFRNDMQRASLILNELRIIDDEWLGTLRDAVAVHRDLTGALKMDQSYQPTGWQGAGWGGTLGLFIGVTLAIPFTAGASAPIAAGAIAAAALGGAAFGATDGALDASLWKDKLGIADSFVEEVSTLVQPGSSAIYAILEAADNIAVVATFQQYGGAVVETVLSVGLKAKVESAMLDAGL